MSRGPYPLMLMLAMSLPSTVRALGLGDLHVNSALNEPLSAQIDLVGATPQELLDLRAAIANRDIFQRYGADRPAFLTSAKFKVGRNAQGRPVLNVRSEDAFTDPLVRLLVDLRWPHGELVREYSLLLDPPGYPTLDKSPEYALQRTPGEAPSPTAFATPTAIAPTTALATPTAPQRYRTNANDTLRAITRRAGARNESDVQRMMIAIFRSNPRAFGGNINLLHQGAYLNIPTSAEAATITAGDAEREVRAHMTAWRLDNKAPAVVAAAPAGPAGAASLPTRTAAGTATDALKERVQSLEHALDDMQHELASQDARVIGIRQQEQPSDGPTSASRQMVNTAARLVPAAAAAELTDRLQPKLRTPAASAATTSPHSLLPSLNRLVPFGAGIGLLLVGFAMFRLRHSLMLAGHGKGEKAAAPAVQLTQAPTVGMDASAVDLLLAGGTTTTSVDSPVVAERRTNIVDVLKAAIERDPRRHDLRLKLMEIYHGFAMSNQQAFLEVARQLSKDQLSAPDWNSALAMGREIAPGNAMFADSLKMAGKLAVA